MIAAAAEKVGLDLGQFESDRGGNDVRTKVKADLELGIRLGVDETPAIFVNGRRAPDVRLQSIQTFILSEIASRSPAAVHESAKTDGDGK